MIKARVVVVSSYGNPLSLNIWTKYYEKYFINEVDEVLIISGGSESLLNSQVISANTKLCQLVNARNKNSKLKYFFIKTFEQGNTISTHAHLLYHGTQIVRHRYEDATILYMDDDFYVFEDGYIDYIFKKLETDKYYFAALETPRENMFCGKETRHFQSQFIFTDLKRLSVLMDSYETDMTNFYTDRWNIYDERLQAYMLKLGNFFGSNFYPEEFKFSLINLNIDCEEGTMDEVFWLFSVYHKRYYGHDKFYKLKNQHYEIALYNHDEFDKDIESFIDNNVHFMHIGGIYRMDLFIYDKYSIKDIHDNLNDGDLYTYKNIKLYGFLKTCMDAWDWSPEQIDVSQIYDKVSTYYNEVMSFDNLPSLINEKNVDTLSKVIMNHI